MSLTIAGFEIALPVVTLGLVTGMTYGVLAVGLVLTYRARRIINFAHGQVGAFGAAILGVATLQWHLPYWIALAFALVAAAAVGWLTEVLVIRRLRGAPRLMSVVATLGVAQFLMLLAVVVNVGASSGASLPQPAGLPTFSVGALRMTPAYTGMLFLTPLVVVGLTAFLRLSRVGLAIRGAADNADSALLSGISATRMSALAWSVAAALSCFTAVLVLPTQGFTSGDTFGPTLLLRALVPAIVARMTSLPIALGGGIAVGVIEQEILWNHPRSGVVDLVLLSLVLVVLLVQPAQGGREDEGGNWLTVRPWIRAGAAQRHRVSRHLGTITFVSGAAVAVGLARVVTNSSAVTLSTIAAFSLVGLSIGVVTGLGGEISFGQFALAGVGATVSHYVVAETGIFWTGLVAAAIAAAAVSVLIGLPALRISGLMLAATTLGFALASSTWLFRQPWMLGRGVTTRQPIIGSIVFDTGRRYYLFSLLVLGIGLVIARNVWRSGLGRRLVAVRDNRDAARAFAVRATSVRVQAFVLGGLLAGLGGAVFGHSITFLSGSAFPTTASIDAVAMTVLGGIGVLVGPLLGALYIIGIPHFLPLDAAGVAATSFGWLLLVLQAPGGLAQVIAPLRQRLISRFDSRGVEPNVDVVPGPGDRPRRLDAVARSPRQRAPGGGHSLVVVDDVAKSFGGVVALNGVSLTIAPDEIVGLIGPNGAGKTTLFEAISGFVRPERGRILYEGRDVTRWTPEARARAGMVRSFQDAALFATMTVHESVCLASEHIAPAGFVAAIAGVRRRERAKAAHADELVDLMGLGGYRDMTISQLSTGTRRIVDLTCAIALEPTLLLLDEPSSGIAQRETEALGELLLTIRRALGTTMIVIEHDIPLVMGLATRVVAMETGRIIASGSPDEVRRDPLVVAAYLGTDQRAIGRSGETGGAGSTCAALTRSGSPCRRKPGVDGMCGQHRRLASTGAS